MAVRQFTEKEPTGEFKGPFPISPHPLVEAFQKFSSDPIEGVSQKSQGLYVHDIKLFLSVPDILDVFNQGGSPAAVEQFILTQQGRCSLTTLRREVQALRTFLKWSRDQGFLSQDTNITTPIVRVEHSQIYAAPPLTAKQEERLYKVAESDSRTLAIVTLGLEAGAKSEELVPLNNENIIPIFEAHEITATRVDFRERVATLEGMAADRVLSHKVQTGRGPLFPSRTKGRLTRMGIWVVLKKYGALIGRSDLDTSVLRETYVAKGISEGKFKDSKELGKALHISKEGAQVLFNRNLKQP